MTEESTLQKLKRYDHGRPGMPGEHWIVLAVGVGAWMATCRHHSVVVKMLGAVASVALVARAASGREGLGTLLRCTPVVAGIRRT